MSIIKNVFEKQSIFLKVQKEAQPEILNQFINLYLIVHILFTNYFKMLRMQKLIK